MIAIDFPFRVSNGSIATTTDNDRVVRGQVIDVIVTNEGERLMRPQWGCNIQSTLFEPADALERSDMASYTKERVNALLPRAIVRDVVVENPAAERNLVFVKVAYKASQYTETQNVDIGFVSGDGVAT